MKLKASSPPHLVPALATPRSDGGSPRALLQRNCKRAFEEPLIVVEARVRVHAKPRLQSTQILLYLKDPKVWELWYIPYYG